MKRYVCPVCGYVYEGDELPEGFKRPICGVSGEKFQVVEGDLKLAAEHEFGIGTKLDGVPEEDKKFILDQLKANFNGECSEVGMYLCMARIAHREGYPEQPRARTGRRPPTKRLSMLQSSQSSSAASSSRT